MSKEIRKPDDPAKKTSDSLMTKIKKKLDGLKTAKNDKIITYVITAIIAICLGVYVITQFVMDDKSTKENNTTQEGQEFVKNLDNTEAMWILPDGSKVYSDGVEAYIKK